MPLVSIIANIRNGAPTLRQALDSALAQTFHDWELIVWDDGSTDGSAAIVAEYHDPRIRYFAARQPVPLGRARDLAMSEATGDWLAFLDQDDIWLPRKLALQMALASDNVGLIYGRTLSFWSNGRQRDYDQPHEFSPLPEGRILRDLVAQGCFIAMSSAVLRASAVRELQPIPAKIEVTPDYYLYLALARRYDARAVQQVICRYRVQPGNMTSTHRSEALRESLWLVRRQRGKVAAQVLHRRRAGLATALAVEEIRQGNWKGGLYRLFREGSVAWLAGRPFVHLWRRLRRRLRRPYWMGAKSAPRQG